MAERKSLWFNELHSPTTGIVLEVGEPIAFKRSKYQEIQIFDNEFFGRVLILDGCVMTTERDEFFYHEMLVHPSLVVHPKPTDILIIGGGDGGTLREVLRYKEVNKAVLVELDRDVIELARKYLPTLSVSFSDPRARIVIENGVSFVKKTPEKFDVVIIDSTDPVGPAEVLFSSEFYLDVKRILNEDGILVFQCESPIYHLQFIKEQKEILSDLFENVHFYNTVVPTYPGALWSFAFSSDSVDPLDIKREPPAGLKFYSIDIHRAAFALPPFMRDELA